MTSAFILWPACTRGFGIREKIRCGLRFFGVFLCGFAVFGPPLRLPPKYTRRKVNMGTKTWGGSRKLYIVMRGDHFKKITFKGGIG